MTLRWAKLVFFRKRPMVCIKKAEASFETSAREMECGGRDSNSHRLTPTTPSK